jgi:putative membrane protein
MVNYIIRLVFCGVLVYFIPQYLKGIEVSDIYVALLVAFIMSVLNNFVKPILHLVSLPITFMTLGLFSLVISVAIVYACDYLVDGFSVHGFIAPWVFSFLLSIGNGTIGLFQSKKKSKK